MADDSGATDQIIKIQQIQKQDDDKLIRSFVLNIISNSANATFDKIYSMLRNVYMVGQGVQKQGVEELLYRMAQENKIAFNGQIYTLYSK